MEFGEWTADDDAEPSYGELRSALLMKPAFCAQYGSREGPEIFPSVSVQIWAVIGCVDGPASLECMNCPWSSSCVLDE